MGVTGLRDKSPHGQRPSESRPAKRAGPKPGRLPDLARMGQPIDIRSLSLSLVATLAVLYTFYFAQMVLMPLVLAILFSFLLAPLVRGLRRIRIPAAVGAASVLLLLLASLCFGAYQLADPLSEWIDRAPRSFRELNQKLRNMTEKGPVAKVSEAAEEVDNIAIGGGESTRKNPVVEVRQPGVLDRLQALAPSLVFGASVTVVLLYFLLASEDLFLRKIVKLLPSLADKKRAVFIIREIESTISTYLLTVTLVNATLGLLVGGGLALLGMPNPALWATIAAVANFVPYLGAVLTALVLTIAAIFTFESLPYSLLVPSTYLALTAIEGALITPLILGHRLLLNPVVIFLSLLLWGWLWGVAGMILAVPMLVTVKIICDEIEPLRPIGELLGS